MAHTVDVLVFDGDPKFSELAFGACGFDEVAFDAGADTFVDTGGTETFAQVFQRFSALAEQLLQNGSGSSGTGHLNLWLFHDQLLRFFA